MYRWDHNVWLSLQLGTEASNETHKGFLSLPELNHSSQTPASFPNFAVLKFANGYSARIVDCPYFHWSQSCMTDMCHLPYIWQRTLYYHLPESVTSQGKIYQNKVAELKAHVKDVLCRKIYCSNTFLCPENSSLRMAKWISLWELPIKMVTFNTPTLKPLMTRASFGMARSKSINLLLNLATNL